MKTITLDAVQDILLDCRIGQNLLNLEKLCGLLCKLYVDEDEKPLYRINSFDEIIRTAEKNYNKLSENDRKNIKTTKQLSQIFGVEKRTLYYWHYSGIITLHIDEELKKVGLPRFAYDVPTLIDCLKLYNKTQNAENK